VKTKIVRQFTVALTLADRPWSGIVGVGRVAEDSEGVRSERDASPQLTRGYWEHCWLFHRDPGRMHCFLSTGLQDLTIA